MAESKILPKVIIKTLSATTTTNSYVSPYGAYKRISADIPSGYKVLGITVKGGATTNPGIAKVDSGGSNIDVYSKSADTFEVITQYYK